jgi:hypothetical protein
MSVAIDFAVRGAAGGISKGSVSGDQGNFIQVGAGDSISLNTSQASVLSYRRIGADLVVELADGQLITLANYFDTPAGIENHLYLSSDGQVTEVMLTEGTDGVIYADYGQVMGWDKWSPLDDLRFMGPDQIVDAGLVANEEAGMGIFMPGLVGMGAGGAGIAAAAVVGGGLAGGGGGGGGGGDGDGDGLVDPAVNGTGTSTTVTTNTADTSLTVTGTGEPGDTVTVTIGTRVGTGTIGADNRWSVTFDDLPADGNHTASAVFTHTDGTTTTLPGPSYIIDMTPPAVDMDDQGTVNLAEYDAANGVNLTGTAEPGAAISVVIDGHTRTTAADATTGVWTVSFTDAQVLGGNDVDRTVTITATDALGNRSVITETLNLDTVPNPLAIGAVAGNDIVSDSEIGSALTVGGTTAPNASVTLSIAGVSPDVTVVANASGVWTHTYATNPFPAATTDAGYTRVITATTTDAAGNASSTTHSVAIDTETSVNFTAGTIAVDNVVNRAEAGGPITLTGKAEAGSTLVMVSWAGATVPATVDAAGNWTVTFAANTATGVDSGNQTVTVTSTDAAGNTATATRALNVDLDTTVTLQSTPVGADNVLSGGERSAGLTLTGTAEAGSTVWVTLNGTTREVTAPGGTWTATFATSELPSGESSGTQAITVMSRDAAGNTSSTVTHTIGVDTLVNRFTEDAIDLGSSTPTTLNASERSAGVLIGGEVEAGSSVTLTIGLWSHTIPGSATMGGTWSYTVPAAAFPEGPNASATVVAVATDAYGNTSSPISSTIAIDTVVTGFSAADISLGSAVGTSSGFLSAAEVLSGLPVSGRAEAFSTINVTVGNATTGTHTISTTADASGNWSVNFTAAQLPRGEISDVPVTVTARDPAGNTAVQAVSFDLDTVAPTAPVVRGILKLDDTLDMVVLPTSTETYDFFRVDTTGAATSVAASETSGATTDRFTLTPGVPDGSYLVIRNDDAAGNEGSTLFLANNAGVANVELSREGLQGFDLTLIDLSQVGATLSITEAQLRAVTGPDATLTIRGEGDDTVTLNGVTAVRENQIVNGQLYDIYTLGSGATLLLEDDVARTVI